MSYAPILTEPALNNQKVFETKPSNYLNKSRKPESARRKNKQSSNRQNGASHDYPIIVHSHLCWDWVWQRPQQFVSRLSKRHKILFVETVAPDPALVVPAARFRQVEKYPNTTILTVQFPAWRWGDGAYVDSERRRIVQQFVAGPGSEFENPVQWFYDPMAVPAFAGQMGERLTVYDCMDELSRFRCAPPEMSVREAKLLALADVVFTGGRKLWESKRRHHENCHFYGCGVDVAHFGKALKPETPIATQLESLSKPVLGYFGVVDERLDYDLIARLADANPEWSVAIVGPVLKVEEASLPRRANLHWLGGQPYADLPSFCKGFNICLMPFALNEATEFINPTKALEYMATGRPIISSAVPDVVANFGEVVHVADDVEEFISLCRKATARPDAERTRRGLAKARENTWERIVSELEGHVEEALKTRVAA
ncbi:MAG TPA: glycosyltransferase [Candidatus Dormibacteraeota bacterium]|nr:glycosyltransferase [Candidatus Dormibacteraeota bacterium]